MQETTKLSRHHSSSHQIEVEGANGAKARGILVKAAVAYLANPTVLDDVKGEFASAGFRPTIHAVADFRMGPRGQLRARNPIGKHASRGFDATIICDACLGEDGARDQTWPGELALIRQNERAHT